MSDKKPEPLHSTPQRALCPVCGYASYSQAGIHPQCAIRQSDANTKKNRRLPLPKPPGAGIKPARRLCPQCATWQHVRKVCACGHTFAIRTRTTLFEEGGLS